jgi:hypothetical protein
MRNRKLRAQASSLWRSALSEHRKFRQKIRRKAGRMRCLKSLQKNRAPLLQYLAHTVTPSAGITPHKTIDGLPQMSG